MIRTAGRQQRNRRPWSVRVREVFFPDRRYADEYDGDRCASFAPGGVVAAEAGHVSVHEAGATNLQGHKVLTLPGEDGKIEAETL